MPISYELFFSAFYIVCGYVLGFKKQIRVVLSLGTPATAKAKQALPLSKGSVEKAQKLGRQIVGLYYIFCSIIIFVNWPQLNYSQTNKYHLQKFTIP
jgi:hypothetical protein